MESSGFQRLLLASYNVTPQARRDRAELVWPARGAKGSLIAWRWRGKNPAAGLRRPRRAGLCALAASLCRLQVGMGRKGSARGSSGERCFLLGPFRNGARVDAPLRREALSPPLARAQAGLPVPQLRFLLAPCLAGAWLAALAAALAARRRAVARPSSIRTHCACGGSTLEQLQLPFSDF